MSEVRQYDDAVQAIKTAILQSQYEEWSFLDAGIASGTIENGYDLALASAKLISTDTSAIWHPQMPKIEDLKKLLNQDSE